MKRVREIIVIDDDDGVICDDLASFLSLGDALFVDAFFMDAIAHLVLHPEADDHVRPIAAGLCATNRRFYRLYHEAHRTRVYPHLDRRFATFEQDYDAWDPKLEKDQPGQTCVFTPLAFGNRRSDPRARISRLSVLHWLANHRYAGQTMGKRLEAIDDRLRVRVEHNWAVGGDMFDMAIETNVLGKSWKQHVEPTLACALVASGRWSHDDSVSLLAQSYMNALVFNATEDPVRQKEYVLVWIFYAMMTGLHPGPNGLSNMHDWHRLAAHWVGGLKMEGRYCHNWETYKRPEYPIVFKGLCD